MSEGRAVFLSYASDDAEAARRIAEALRAAGIEVWFDQSELRSGDAWDQKIRREIRECALFVPIISANTQSRLEGYFRREWRQGVDRIQDMADGVPFLVPISIDATTEKHAHVPEAFRAVQWTKLPGGQTTPEFVARVARLLEPGAVPDIAKSPGRRSDALTTGKPKKTWFGRAMAILGVLIACYFIFDLDERFAPETRPQPPAPPSRDAYAPAAANASSDKSIAVLPFVDMSEKHDQEYFSDGLAEELLNVLAKVPDLQVTARTSSFSFKGTSDDIPTIAKKLGVAHVLEGSVRKAGKRLRITAQLVRADNGLHVWSETYDRSVDDVFKVQDEIARIVVEKLKGTLLGDVPAAATAGRTSNPEAHALYLQAQFSRQLDTDEGIDAAIGLFQRALRIDPDYAQAWSSLSAVYSRQLSNYGTASDPRIGLARQAATRAIELDPGSGDARATLAFLSMMVDLDWLGAEKMLARAREFDPSNRVVLFVSGTNARALGEDAAAIAFFRQSIERDPVNLLTRRYYSRILLQANRVDDAEREIRRLLELSPTFPAAQYNLGLVLLAKKEPAAAQAAFEKETSPIWRPNGIPLGLHAVGRDKEALAALAKLAAEPEGASFQLAENYAYLGKRDEAFRWLNTSITERDPGLLWMHGNPLLRSLEGDPRYAEILRKANLPR